jgi:hypothetical protein
MAFKTDSGGIAFKASDAKLQANASTWATKLSQLARQTGIVRIVTYSLPDMDYVRIQLGRRPRDILLIAHSKFESRARDIRREFPDIRVAVHDKVHSKVLLVAPQTIVISSANFGDSTWHETSVSFHSQEAHDWYVERVFQPLWDQCREID